MDNECIVFLVDDNEVIRDSLSLSLRLAGFTIETYASGPDFLNAYGEYRPGCLLIDLHMPRMNGLEVQQELNRRNIQMPIIFMTGYGTAQDATASLKAGAVDFLIKPISGSILYARIHDALSQVCPTHTVPARRLQRK
ncbi:response regulator transcription factor [Methylomicrobium lacus]|uniref:response regulator transcription factor n=1 Tax=Methylomicrobium lacus TaxID=136992 RepID=UPI0035A956CD